MGEWRDPEDWRDYFEDLIYRSMGSHRFTQESPILPDVWLAYALDPGEPQELLLSPWEPGDGDAEPGAAAVMPHELARRLLEQLKKEARPKRYADGENRGEVVEDDPHRALAAKFGEKSWRVAPHQSAVAVRLRFYELIRAVLPLTGWWRERLDVKGSDAAGEGVAGERGEGEEGELSAFRALRRRFSDQRQAARLMEDLKNALAATTYDEWAAGQSDESKLGITPQIVWLVRLAGTIAWVHDRWWSAWDEWEKKPEAEKKNSSSPKAPKVEELERLRGEPEKVAEVIRSLFQLLHHLRFLELGRDRQGRKKKDPESPYVGEINKNRISEPAIYRTGNVVKADAVRKLFSVRGALMRWAVVDSGIDASHLAFRRRDADGRLVGAYPPAAYGEKKGGPVGAPLEPARRGVRPADDDEEGNCVHGGAFVRHPKTRRWLNQTRIRGTWDFTRLRDLVSLDPDEIKELRAEIKGEPPPDGLDDEERERRDLLRQLVAHASALGLAKDLDRAVKFGSAVDWDLLGKLLEIPHNEGYEPPKHHHGTHVAGIIGADWRKEEHALSPRADRVGVAPEIELYDLRALGPDGSGDEFSLMAAMQFVAHLNARKTGHHQLEVHGVNLSFSLRHDVSNFACGWTPVCAEATRLVGRGLVVVAAAGNQGRTRYMSAKGKPSDGYRSISITDPGNTEAVITVGATHREEPHNYGVSYFSSRGPTGDGRRKPDLVAPGERVYSTVPDNKERDLDGTSMAAPHVSGAAALLLERNLELVGQPARVKQILCDSATDLGREPYFQGHGMLDILRALQSV